MPQLYLLRHGQTQFNLKGLVQGRCDSPLTELGVSQAHAAGAWLAEQNVAFARIVSSPLGRAHDTARIAAEELSRGAAAGMCPEPPAVELEEGIIERDFGPFEQGSASEVPCELWDPGEALVAFGGEGSAALRARMVEALVRVMDTAAGGNVLAVSHGSASLQFKLAWAELAQCDQEQPIGNCCVMVFDYDPATREFSNVVIHNQ